ncbi:FtsX-like permease family protein [Nocardia sp. NPDC050712]|uniref:ABC transporter permease n=1 Tax=Nocardia sp. NPDC050712 TaxID=3155518 RepID=UPI0033EF88F5
MPGSPMRKVALRNLAAHKVRLALTLLSVVLGTAFVAGTFVFTDTLQRTFDDIFANEAVGVDIRVSPEERQAFGVPLAVVDKVERTAGVRAVEPSMLGPAVLLDSKGKPVQTGGAPSQGQSYTPADQAVGDPEKFVLGVPPSKPGEIAINSGAAARAGLKVGDSAKVVVPSRSTAEAPTIPVTVTGLFDMPTDTGLFVGMLFEVTQARQLFTNGTSVAYLDIAAAPGVGVDELRDRIGKELPGFKVQNGDQVRADLREQVSKSLNFLNYFLLAFVGIAVIASTSIIYNTFSMIVAQRLRELALLRAVGASRPQVGRTVVVEAFVIGLVGSVLGLAAGIGLAYGLSGLMNSFELGVPTGSMTVLPRTIVVGLLVGLLVTVISACAPAWRASKIPPVEAMREEYKAIGESLRRRTRIGAGLAVLGVLLVGIGAQWTGKVAAEVVGGGAVALIAAVLLAGPALSQPVLRALGVLTRPFGPIGRMARNNAVRNPRRTAATAFALTLGLMLVSIIGMAGASAKATVDELVDKGVRADFVLVGPSQNQLIGLPIGVPDKVRASVPEAGKVVGFRGTAAQIGDDSMRGVSPDAPISGMLNYTMRSGTDTLGPGDILVSQDEAEEHNLTAGQRIELSTFQPDPENQGKPKKVPVTISGIYENSTLLGEFVAAPDLFTEITPTDFQNNFIVLVAAKPGSDLTAMRASLENAVKDFALAQVQDPEQFKGTQAQQINMLLAILYGLLGLAVVIAIIGVINTLALSVVERRREIGMLRAVGTARAQVRRTIYLESMLIAVFGAIVGVLLGIGLGYGFLRTLSEFGLDQIAVPWTQLLLVLVSSGVIGVLAALWPGIQAARTPPLAAIADL